MGRSAADAPVLMTVFNRPEKTRAVLDAVRSIGPRHLFVAADGPRPGVASDVDRCRRTRELFDDVGWDCEVRTLFRDQNLGCKIGVSSGITWFLDAVDAGIILEDDCVPSQDFFRFCAELLDRYRDAAEVMMVSGQNQLGQWTEGGASYTFSQTTPIWGWATWRRAWSAFDPAIAAWADPAVRARIRASVPRAEYRSMSRQFDNVYHGRLDSWANGWAFAMLRCEGLTAVAGRNLIANIGFDGEATHTKNRLSFAASLPAYDIDFPLVHPERVAVSEAFDAAVFHRRFPLSRRVVSALPWSVQRPLRAALQHATGVVARTAAAGRAVRRRDEVA